MVRTGITWTVTIISNWVELIDGMLLHLKENGVVFRTDVPKGHYEAVIRDDHLTVLENVGLVELMNPKAGKQKQQYNLTDSGDEYVRYVRQKDQQQKDRLLHNLFYSGISHYRYAYDCILEDNLYEFSDREFNEHLVIRSTSDFGVRLYDQRSYKNVIHVLKGIGVAEKNENGNYVINSDYRMKFNEDKFKKIVRELLGEVDLEYTKVMCRRLLNRSDEFLSVPEPGLTILNILKRLKKLREEGNIEFVAGIPKPPIEAAYTLIRWVQK